MLFRDESIDSYDRRGIAWLPKTSLAPIRVPCTRVDAHDAVIRRDGPFAKVHGEPEQRSDGDSSSAECGIICGKAGVRALIELLFAMEDLQEYENEYYGHVQVAQEKLALAEASCASFEAGRAACGHPSAAGRRTRPPA